jgi:integrase/recombinase XerD
VAVERLNDKQLIKLFKEDCDTRGFTEGTIESYISTLKLFSQYLKKKGYSLLTVDRDTLKGYISDLRKDGINQKTIENRFSTFSSLYDYAVYEDFLEKNLVKDIRKRYLKQYKENNNHDSARKLISVAEMARFIQLILDLRDKTIVVLLAKTGIRRSELVAIDVDDINWHIFSIVLKPKHKRSNCIIFFDYECALVLKQWLQKREHYADPENKALFVSYIDRKKRLDDNGVWSVFVKWAELAKLHDSASDKMDDHFTPHCCRHWFTTYLRRAGMPREYIKWLRGDALTDAMDIYNHIDPDDVRKSYLACIPKLGIQ